jgi:hypothetical protein
MSLLGLPGGPLVEGLLAGALGAGWGAYQKGKHSGWEECEKEKEKT